MAVGRNRNKIYAVAVACFWITVFVIVFTLPYLYYSANLGPKTGFVYTGLCIVTWLYVFFCVGEVQGRSFEEIDGFFRDGIPARKWKAQPRLAMGNLGEKGMAQSEMDSGELEKVDERVANWLETKS